MKTIYKYPLLDQDEQFIEMPKGARLLSVGVQNNTPVLWAEVNTANKNTSAQIRMFGTGQPDIQVGGLQFIGTVQLYGGTLIFHVYGSVL